MPASIAGLLIARCLMLSGKRMMNTDELFTWCPVSAPFRSMLASTADTINASPPLYFVGAWYWAALFGNSALSLRLLSALAVAAAILALFVVLRRAYGTLAASAGMTMALLDPELLFQSGDARFYAPMLAEFAIGIVLYQRIMVKRRPSAGLLAANAALHACLVMTHYFGLLYSGVILGAGLLTCLSRRRNPLPAALSILAGWLAFLPWIPVFLRHIQMGKPTFWISVPNGADLRDYFAHFVGGDFWLPAAMLVLFAIAAASVGGSAPGRPVFLLHRVRRREAPLLILAALLGLVPLLVYFASRRPGSISVFLDRYMTACDFGWAIVCAHVANRAFGQAIANARRGALRALATAQVTFVVFFIGIFGWKLLDSAHNEAPQALPVPLPAVVRPSEPVVVENMHDFLALHFYSPEPQRYLFLIDREAAARLGGASPSNHQIMETLKRRFPWQFTEVGPQAAFLGGAQTFWVMAHDLRWWNIRLGRDSPFVADIMVPKLGLVHERRRD